MNIRSLVIACCLLLATSVTASATILSGCASCQGGTYDLTYYPISIGATNDVFNFTLVVDTTGYTGGGLYINAVALKPSESVVAFDLFSAPTSNPGGSVWTTESGGINANGCSGAGAGFFCSESTGLGAVVSNLTNTWTWVVTIPHNSLFVGEGEASLKVLYVNAIGEKKGDVVSEPITIGHIEQVPEPATVLLLGGGLLVFGLLKKNPLK